MTRPEENGEAIDDGAAPMPYHRYMSERSSSSTMSASSLETGQAGRRADALILVIECDRPAAGSSRHLLHDLDEVLVARGRARSFERVLEGSSRRLVLYVPDQRVSTQHARLRRYGPSWYLEDFGSKNGSLVNGVRRERCLLGDGDVVECGRTFFRFRAQQEWALDLAADCDSSELGSTTAGLVTFHEPLARQLRTLPEVARANLPVLVLGPSGSGKELVARALHELSSRSGAYVAVNCGALPESLVEAELFGSRKGAFTGAVENREGLVRSSDGGTLFLDEIGDLPQRAQPTLLRVLQEREVTPVGTTRAAAVDLRVVAATHRDLDAMVQRQQFRSDLLARLSGFLVRLPPLAQRIDDLGILIAALLARHAASAAPTLGPEAMRLLLLHRWPLNIRELEHTLTAGLALAPARIDAEHLPRALREPTPSSPALAAARPARELSPEQLAQRDQLLALLTEHQGNISQVARRLNKDRVQIRRWIRFYGISLASFKE